MGVSSLAGKFFVLKLDERKIYYKNQELAGNKTQNSPHVNYFQIAAISAYLHDDFVRIKNLLRIMWNTKQHEGDQRQLIFLVN